MRPRYCCELLPGAFIDKGSISIGGEDSGKAVGIQKTMVRWRTNQHDEASLVDFVMWIKVGSRFLKTHTKVAHSESVICNQCVDERNAKCKEAIHS